MAGKVKKLISPILYAVICLPVPVVSLGIFSYTWRQRGASAGIFWSRDLELGVYILVSGAIFSLLGSYLINRIETNEKLGFRMHFRQSSVFYLCFLGLFGFFITAEPMKVYVYSANIVTGLLLMAGVAIAVNLGYLWAKLDRHKKVSGLNYPGAAAVLLFLIAAAVFYPAYISKARSQDLKRVEDLRDITRAIYQFAGTEGRLPVSLDELDERILSIRSTASYKYMADSEKTFSVCSEFRAGSPAAGPDLTFMGEPSREQVRREISRWKYKKGWTCFSRTWESRSP
jgi:hypothetical protein